MSASRWIWIALVLGVVGIVGLGVLALFHAAVMPSYFAAWLCCMALPLGALPLVMLLECCDAPERLTLPFRSLLPLLPLGLLAAIPVMVTAGALFQDDPAAGPSDGWMAPAWFVTRMVVILVLLSLLALLFQRAPAHRPRRDLAIAGLGLHVVLVSFAAFDWVLAWQPGLGSSAIGLLLIASQAGAASCIGALLLLRLRPLPEGVGAGLALLLAIWGFLHFIQYLVIWSADLPAEVTWYQARLVGTGGVCVVVAVTIGAVALALLIGRLARIPVVVAGLAGAVLLMHLGETWWLVTPAFRGRFVVVPADAMAMLTVGGMLAALLLAWSGRWADARR